MLRFGTFELDEDKAQLRRNGTPVKLAPQPFRLLLLLASRPGELVTRDEIRQQIWGGDTFVDFDQGVNFCVKQVRAILRDDADSPVYVETVPRRGYRFIAPVERVNVPVVAPRRSSMDSKLERALWTNIAELRLTEARRRRRLTLALIGVGIVAVAAIVLAILR
jgi:DNA-binding winged helix-turn-helix (wHTH) protein